MEQMTDTNPTQPQSIIVIDLRELLWVLLKGSWLIILLAAIGVVFGIRHLHDHVPLYEASMIVAPTSESGGSGRVSAKLGILAGIAGDIGSAARVTLFDRLKQIFGSREFAVNMEKRHQLIGILYGSSWDEEKQVWKEPSGLRYEIGEIANKFLKQTQWHPPDIESLSKYLVGSIDFEMVEGTPFYKVSTRNRDGEFALWILQSAYAEAERILRFQDREQVHQRQDYLEAKLEKVQLQDLRGMFLEMLQGEVRRAMLLDSDLPYAARVIEAASVSTRPNVPSLNLEIGWRMTLGFLLGIILILINYFVRRP